MISNTELMKNFSPKCPICLETVLCYTYYIYKCKQSALHSSSDLYTKGSPPANEVKELWLIHQSQFLINNSSQPKNNQTAHTKHAVSTRTDFRFLQRAVWVRWWIIGIHTVWQNAQSLCSHVFNHAVKNSSPMYFKAVFFITICYDLHDSLILGFCSMHL